MGMLTFRRYRQQKARAMADAENDALAHAHVAAVAATTPSVPLPDTFPARDLLAAAPVPYVALEDLYGATEAELVKVPGIGRKTAERIIAARDALEAEA